MARVKLSLPDQFHFYTIIPIRITDVNYGGHVGNDALLGIIHEARMQFLAFMGYNEMNIAGAGLIMSDVIIEFKQEAFYGDKIKISVGASDFSRAGFDIYYKLEKEAEGITATVANAKTGMVCYNYTLKKVMAIPEAAIIKLQGA
ncbi:MAG: thioesterase family protein [Niabella sp.]